MGNPSRSTSRSHCSGYCLVLTVLMLALVSTMLLTASRGTIRRSMQAKQEARDLQRRWGMRSLTAALSGTGADLLREVERKQSSSLASHTISLSLCSVPFEVRIADESAKLDVNTLINEVGKPQAARILRQHLSHSAMRDRLLLRPRTLKDRERIDSFAEIFLSPSFKELTGRGDGVAISDQVTFTGNGRVNLLRADERVLHAVLDDAIGAGAVNQLIALINTREPMNLPAMLDRLHLTEAQQRTAARLLTLDSDKVSMMILAEYHGRFVIQERVLEW